MSLTTASATGFRTNQTEENDANFDCSNQNLLYYPDHGNYLAFPRA